MSRLLFVPFALIASVSFGQVADPLVRITSPTAAVVETSATSIVLTGVASGGVTRVHWVGQTWHRGNAILGNSVVDGGQNQVSWSTDAILLRPGTNQITVVAVDAQNHSSTATVAIVSSRSPSYLPLRPDIRTGVWRGQMVTYEVVDGLAIAAGDMILGTAEEVAAGSEIGNKADAPKAGPLRRANSIDYTSLLWPRVGPVVQVPFTIQAGSASAAVANAVASFNASLSGFVQYVARGAEANFVTFNLSAADTSGACQSSVGMVGGQQFITGSGDCGVSTLVHEMGHSIGLYHEHQRTDNATFITANLANADKPLIAGNFDAITSNQQNVGLYDFASVMQYPAFSFSKAGLPVLESIPAGIPLSNDVGFSLGDIDGIRRLYGYAPTQVTVTTNPPGLGIIVDGATLTAPQTFSWAIASSHTLDLPADPQVTSPADGSTYMYGRWNDSVTRSHSVIVAAGAGFLTSPSNSPAVTVYEANFIRLQPFGTAVFPGGTGTVSPSPAPQSIFSGTFYRDRQQITLTGTPTGANHFAGWFNIPFPQSENPKTYFIQSPTPSATGGFTGAAVTLFGASVTGPNPTNPGLFGTVDGNFEFLPQAFANDPNFGGPAWASGTSHTLAVSTPESPVTTNVRYLFSSWADAAPAVPSRSITAPSSGVQSFTAVFNPVYRTFPLLSPTCGGNVNFSPVSPTNDGFYADGSLLSVTAVPNAGISFGGWFGDLSGNTNPSNVTIHDQFIPGAFFNSTTTPISVTGFSPANTTVTGAAMDLIVTGTGFTASTQAFWNLSFRSSTFNSSTQITVHLLAGDLATAGGNRVSVQNVVNGCSLFVEGTFDVKSASTVWAITKTHTGSFNVGQQGATYNISVSNTGTVVSTGPLTVTDTLPTGLTYVSGIGNFWSCGAVAQVVTCTYSLTVAPSGGLAQVLTITVNVATNAPVGTNSITNSATASGGGASNSPTANDPTTVLGPAVFTITKTHVGNFNVGQQNATYNILVGNTAAAGPTVGSTTVTDTLPTGLTYVSGIGNFWSCSAVAQVVTCNYSLVLNPNNSAQGLTITMNVASNAPVGTNSITNSATASGGGASNSPTANDPTTILGPAVFTITKTHVGNFNVGQQNATYNILVGNSAAAGPTVGSTTVTDTLPTGLTYVSGIGNFWTCGAVAQVVTCTYSLVVSPNSNAQALTLTVNVASNAPVGTNSITNSATVSGGGASNSPTANDPTTVLGPAVFTITKNHVGNFNVGQQNATYNILVGNTAAAGPTVGSTTVTDTLPTGLTYVSGIGNFWTCGAVAQVVTCTYSLVVSPNSNAQALTLTVNVASNAPVGTNSITNSATVSGGGASNSPTANDPTTVLGPAVFTITKNHVGNFNVGQQNATYNILVGNTAAAGPTVGSTTVTDTLPTGLTYVSGIGNFWTCSAVAQVVTCTYSLVVSPNSNAQALTLTVNVASNVTVGTNSITNSATASGGGASNSPTATDPTTIVAGPPTSMALNPTTTPQSTAVSTAFPVALAVTLKDVGTNPTPGINVTFTAPGAGASGKFTNNGTTIVVATDATGVASAAFTSNATAGGPYNVSASSGALTAVNFSLTNTAAGSGPVITQNPTDATLNAGQTATFMAAANGTPTPTVQWQFSTDGGATFNNVAGATTTTLTIPNVLAGQNGTKFRAVFTNGSGSATTTAATMTVNFAPSVTTNPTSQSVAAASTATFVAAASGNPTPTVQWQLSTNGGGTFSNIAGATATTLSFTAQVTDNGNQYRAVFTNTVGSATTTAATLTMTAGPLITQNPVNATVNAGQTATFTAAASGTPTPTVQWQFSTDGGATFNNVAGATTTTLTIPNVLAGQNGTKFRAVFTNGSGSATTTAATMTVNFAPSVTTNPTSQSVSAGSTATFVAAASGNPTPTVQWQLSTNGGGTFSNIAGATATTLSFTAQGTDNGNQYRAVFTNTVGSATTTAATLTVTAGPLITQNPVNATVNAGQTATFTAAASGTPTPTVQWQFSTDGGATFNNVAGATTTTLTIPNVLAGQNGTKFRAVFTNGSGSATTTAATMTVNFAPSVTTNPTSQSVAAGSTATFVAAASGNPTPTVQWQLSTNGGGTFSNIAGATATTLSFTAQGTDNGNQYRAVFTNTVGSATTTAATLTISAATLQSIAVTPANPSSPKGTTRQFTATGMYSDNSTQNITAQVTWASATTSVATITAGGLATGVNTGTSTISATLSGITGSTVLTVTAAALQSIAVTPANPSIPKGTTQQFTATGTFSDNSTQNLTAQVTWASATTSVATITAGGLATGVSTGTSTISATLSGISGSTVLTVTAAVLQSIAVTPANPSIAKGSTQQFTATGTFSDNSTQNLTAQVTWASATTSVATITAGGLATGVSSGTSTISATLGAVTGSTVLSVTAAVLQSIAVTPANPSIAKGSMQQFTATGTFSDNSTQNLTAQVTWASATTSVATITAGGLATGVSSGTSTISATLGAVTGSTVLSVTAAVLQSIAVTPANPSIAKGSMQQFTATGTFSDNSTQNLTAQVTWASATTSVATITAGGLATGVSSGTSTISATLGAVTGSTVLSVTAAVLQSIAVTPANPSIAKGSMQQFTATGTFSDNSTQNLTAQVTWASATTSVATITAGGLATGVSSGTSTISATLGGVTGSTVLSVTAAVLQSIAVTPPNPSIAQGTTQQFTAMGTFSDNSTQNLTGIVTWASATPSVATITAGGLASGVAPGTSSISATLGGITGSTVLSVTTGATGPTVVSFRVLFGTQSYSVTGSLRNRLPWQITGVQVVFSGPITTANINSLIGLTTTGFSGLGTNTLTWMIVPVAQGALTASLLGSGPDAIKDAGGAPLGSGAGFNQNLKILWADFNDDGIVNASDLVLINNARSAPYTIFADLNGDGIVDINDVQIARTRNGTTLP